MHDERSETNCLMRNDTWEALDDFFAKSPVLKAEGVGADEVAAAEREAGVPLDPDYREFIRRYGGAFVGPFPVFGLRRAVPMGKNEGSFVEVTRAFRDQHWPGTENWIVISMDHSGNPVGLDAVHRLEFLHPRRERRIIFVAARKAEAAAKSSDTV